MKTLGLFIALMASLYFNLEQFQGNLELRQTAQTCVKEVADARDNIRKTMYLVKEAQQKLKVITDVEKLLVGKVKPHLRSRYATAFLAASVKYDIPIRLMITVAGVESNYDHLAVSTANAIGVMQVKPLWIKVIPGLKTVKDLFNIEKNIDAGGFVLAQYKKRFAVTETTLTAYNRGETRVARLLAEGKEPSNGYEMKVINRWEISRPNFL